MKTWEMIKELMENQEKRFRSGEISSRIAYVERGVLFICIEETGRAALDVGLDRRWEEIRKPVSFMEFLRELKNNDSINFSFEHKEAELMYYRCELGYVLQDLAKTFSDCNLADILLEGKWYIED